MKKSIAEKALAFQSFFWQNQTLMKIFSVSELTSAIKALLEPNFRYVSVKGEISNFKVQSSGHLYFSLKDAGSQLSAALFKGNASRLSRMPKEGDQVVAIGEISLYAPRGTYQILVKELQFLGVGELLLQLHQRKEKLDALGYFAETRKKPLPKLPKRIGVVTSPTGAVIQDILHVLTKRFAGFQVLLNPVKVQGEGAAGEIAKAIEDFNRYQLADVLIVGRGGGSIEDLWAFNEEIVAKAIFESQIPIISAVGHETDFTIADLAADVRAPTPSAAAQMAIAEKQHLLDFLSRAGTRAIQAIEQILLRQKKQLSLLQRSSSLASPYGMLAPYIQKLDDVERRLEALHPQKRVTEAKLTLQKLQGQVGVQVLRAIAQNRQFLQNLSRHPLFAAPKNLLAPIRQKIEQFEKEIERVHPKEKLQEESEKLTKITDQLKAMHPKNLLQKGYAILFSEKDGSIILSSQNIAQNQKATARLHDGELKLTIDGIQHDTGNSLF